MMQNIVEKTMKSLQIIGIIVQKNQKNVQILSELYKKSA